MSASSASTPDQASYSSDTSATAAAQRIEGSRKRARESAEQLQQQHAKIQALLEHVLDEEHKQELQEQIMELQQRQQELEQEQFEWQENLAKARKISHAGQQRRIKLNVGGKIFLTTLDTLTSEANTFFTALFSENFDTKPDENGEIFIDRNHRYFDLILDHLRSVDITPMLKHMQKQELEMFQQEVAFYSLAGLVAKVFPWTVDKSKTHRRLKLTRNDDGSTSIEKVTERDRDMDYDMALGEKGFSMGVHEWSVRLDSSGWASFGVCTLHDMEPYIDKENTDESFAVTYGRSSNQIVYNGPGTASGYATTDYWNIGKVIHIKLDCDNGTLIVDGTIITVPRGEELYPCFLLSDLNTRCTLMTRQLRSRAQPCALLKTQRNQFSSKQLLDYDLARIAAALVLPIVRRSVSYGATQAQEKFDVLVCISTLVMMM